MSHQRAASTGLDSHSSTRPKNVEQIVKLAKEYEYNDQVRLRYWLRTASALLKEADIYMREGDDETTYLLLFRHAHLVLAHLVSHPDARDQTVRPLLAHARQEVDRNLKALDNLRPKINQRYDRYTIAVRAREEQKSAQSRRSSDESGVGDTPKPIDTIRKQQLRGHVDRDLAVQLARQEFRRRANVRDDATPNYLRRTTDGDDLSRTMQAVRARVDSGTAGKAEHLFLEREQDQAGMDYNYPSLKARPSPSTFKTHQVQSTKSEPASSTPPSLPPKPDAFGSATLPPRPSKVKESEGPGIMEPKTPTDTTYTFAPAAHLENGNPLRTLFLPPTLRTTFLRLAYRNTMANLETCGFLAGTLISNALFVSKLIIPNQVATSDTCEMTNESQLFDYVDSGADLMILGWIHTHPSQTCFMSSRDLHTHAGYQMMLPESVAIVCAPSKGDTAHGGDWGVYRLTDPPGKTTILNCNKPGVFHPHDIENIYTDALRPGHVVEAKGLEFEVVDLREGGT